MPGPRPLAFGITELNIGGAEKSLVDLVIRLDRSRWSPTVVSLQPLGPLAAELQSLEIPVASLEMNSLRDTFSAYRMWKKLLTESRPAALITFLFHANILGRQVARAGGIPLHVSSIRVAERSAQWHLALDRWTRRSGDRYVCVSQAVADFTHQRVKAPWSDINVIRNGIDLRRIDQVVPLDKSECQIGSSDLVLVAVGRLTKQKGPDVLLDAISKIVPAATQHRLRLVFVGEGPMRASLQSFVREHQLESIVTFVGQQKNALGWIQRSDGLVLASRWEGMPNAVLEAMACRRAVIGTQVEGTNELVFPRKTGWLVPPNDPTALANVLVDWMTSPEKRESFGVAGRIHVEKHFTIQRTVDEWDRLLTQICQ